MKIGERMPDQPVSLSDGTATSLRAFWSTAPTVLVFLRHFG